MAITNYFPVGGTVTAAAVTQGNEVPANNKRRITSALVCNKTGVDKTFTATLVRGTGVPAITLISARTILAGESYECPELVGRGMTAGGYIQVQADVAGMDFVYEAFNITNG